MLIEDLVRSMKPMSLEQKKELGFPAHIFIPTIQCDDGILFPVKDATGLSTGTFSMRSDEDGASIIVPKGMEED